MFFILFFLEVNLKKGALKMVEMYSFIGTLKSSGKENLWLEKEESRIGEIQVCAGLQDQGVEETDWAPREWYQTNEGPNPRGVEPFTLLHVILFFCIPVAHMCLDYVCYRVDYVNVFSMCDTPLRLLLCVVDGERVGEVPQTEHSAGAQHQGAHTETEGHR